MNSKIESRKNFIINLLFVIAIIGLIFVSYKYLLGIVAPFLFAFLFAIVLQKPLRALDKKTKKKFHAGWSIILVLLSICIVIIPLSFLLARLVQEIVDFSKYFIGQLQDLPTLIAQVETWLYEFLKFLPDSLYASATSSISDTITNLLENFDLSSLNINMDAITTGLTSGISGVFSVVKNIPSALIAIVIGVVAWIFFTKDYDYIVRFIQKQLPESKKNLPVEIKQVFTKTVLKMIRAYGLIMLVTFFELFLGFSIMRVTGVMTNNYYILIAICTAIFDVLPAAGSGGILVPWALFSLITGNYKQAIGLMVIYIFMTVFRQYIEPKIVGDSLGVHPLITLMGLYFGLKFFGFMGMFIVPITVMTLKAFNDTGRIHLWNPVDRK